VTAPLLAPPLVAARPAVLADIPPHGHVVLEASAGTGKTFALEHLVVDLLLDRGIPVERMLVVTFTEKATEELRERVRNKLRQLAAGEVTPAGDGQGGWRLDEEARRTLASAVARFDAATLSTIHGFCQRVLTEHSFAHQRLFEQRLVDGRETFARGFRVVLARELGGRGELREPLLAWLREGNSLDRLQELVAESLRQRGELTPRWEPEALRQAAIAFAAACDDTLLQRALHAADVPLAARREHDPRELIARFLAGGEAAAFGDALREWGGGRAKGSGDKGKAERPTRWEALRRGLAALAGDGGVGRSASTAPFAAGRAAASVAGDPQAAAALAALDALADRAAPPLAALVGGLRQAVGDWLRDQKRSLGLYDFDDMLLHVREAVCGRHANPGLVAALRERWQVALIDEFQDTDEVQWDVFRTLFFEGDGGHRLFLIGDPKQAIYGFRNADVHSYLQARRRVLAAGGARVELSANYRSTAPLVEACNRVFAGDFFSGELAHPTAAVAGNAGLAFRDDGGQPLAPVVVVQLRRRGAAPRAAEARAGFAAFVAEEAQLLVQSGVRFADGREERSLRYGDLMVLARARAGAKEMADALRAAGVPHVLFGQDGLLATPEAEHVRRLLAALAAPEDAAARLAAFLTPFFGVPLGDLGACRELPETHPLVARLRGWAELAERRRYPALFRAVLRESGLVRRLLAIHQGERELTDYQHVFDLLLAEAHRSPADVGELQLRLRSWIGERGAPPGMEADVQRLEAERDAVQLLTMHKAKGLQAPVVFVAGLGGSPPVMGESLRVYHRDGERRLHLGKEPMGEIAAAIATEERQESERLYYVALTRARCRLYLPDAGAAKGGRSDGRRSPWRLVQDRLPQAMAERPDLFERREVECAAEEPVEDEPPLRWRPDSALLAAAPDAAPRLLALRRGHAGRILTSYTRIKRGAAAAAEAAAEAIGMVANEELAAEAMAPLPPTPAAVDELPGGRGTGIFLHRLLEELDPATVRSSGDVAEWLARRDVAEPMHRIAAALAVGEDTVPRAGRLVWNALRTPLDLGGLVLPRGLCAVERRAVEMELVFPIPERAHPRLSDLIDGAARREESPDRADEGLAFRAERGFVQGVVDLVFEHEGRTYFVDWKSDRLPAWDAESIGRHVALHYELQAQLYALGVLRLLAIGGAGDHAERFGGLLYCFLRGIGPGGAGIHFARPTWDELRGWERQLYERADWGAA
jgi:exodeoxyribonuclease V beta subunit